MDKFKGLLGKLDGYKTYAAALALLVMAALAFKRGNYDRAGELLAAALAAAGLRAALPNPVPAAPAAPTTPQPPAGTLVPNILGTNVAKTNGKTLP